MDEFDQFKDLFTDSPALEAPEAAVTNEMVAPTTAVSGADEMEQFRDLFQDAPEDTSAGIAPEQPQAVTAEVEQPDTSQYELSISPEEHKALPWKDAIGYEYKSEEEKAYLTGRTKYTPEEQSQPVDEDRMGWIDRATWEIHQRVFGTEKANNIRKSNNLPLVQQDTKSQRLEDEKGLRSRGYKGQEEFEGLSDDDMRQWLKDKDMTRLSGKGLGSIDTAKIFAVIATTDDPAEQVKMALKIIPGSTSRKLANGTYAIKWTDQEGEEHEKVMNPEGMDVADVANFWADAGKGYIANRAGKFFGKLSGFMQALIAGGAAGAIETGVEVGQMAAGGDSPDLVNIGLETMFGFATEAIPAGVKSVYDRFSPAGRQAAAKAKSLKEFAESGLSEADSKVLAESVSTLNSQAKAMGMPPLKAEQIASESKVLHDPLNKALETASQSGKAGDVIEKMTQKQTQAAKEGVEKTVTAIHSGEKGKAKQASKDLIESGQLYRSATAEKNYAAARNASGLIDVSHIVDDIKRTMDLSAKLPQIQNKLKEVMTALRADETASTTVYNEMGMPSTFAKMVNLSFDKLQQINFLMRDIASLKTDAAIIGTVKTQAKAVGVQITEAMNKASGGLYNKADLAYKNMSEAIDLLNKSLTGEAAEKGADQMGGFVRRLFNPNNQKAAKTFMDNLKKVEPQAAKDLYADYVTEVVSNAGNKPSAISKALFGKEGGVNMLQVLAPTKEVGRAMNFYHRYIKSVATTEGASGLKGSAAKVKADSLKGGMWGMIAAVTTHIPSLVRKETGQQVNKATLKTWIKGWSDDKFAKQLTKLLEADLSPAEMSKRASKIWSAVKATTTESIRDEYLEDNVN